MNVNELCDLSGRCNYTTGASVNEQQRQHGVSSNFLWLAGIESIAIVLWFFDRDGERLRYEILRDRVGNCYRLVITKPDGSESIEEVDEPTALVQRSVQLINSLRHDGWRVA